MPDEDTSAPTHAWFQYTMLGVCSYLAHGDRPPYDASLLFNPALGSMQTLEQAAGYVVHKNAPHTFYGVRQALVVLDARAILAEQPAGTFSDASAAALQRVLDGWARDHAAYARTEDRSVRVLVTLGEATRSLAGEHVYELTRHSVAALVHTGAEAQIDGLTLVRRWLDEATIAGLLDDETHRALSPHLRPKGKDLGPPKVGRRKRAL